MILTGRQFIYCCIIDRYARLCKMFYSVWQCVYAVKCAKEFER